MSFGHALYYPHINLTNKNWIKHALLFWDNISRIVPDSVEPSDSEDIITIKNESKFIKDYRPEIWDTSEAFHSFSQELRPILESDAFFNDRFFRRHRERRDYDMHYRNRKSFFSVSISSSFLTSAFSLLPFNSSDNVRSQPSLISSTVFFEILIKSHICKNCE